MTWRALRSRRALLLAGLAAACAAVGPLVWVRMLAPGSETAETPGAPSGAEPGAYRATIVRTVERNGQRTVTETFFARRGDWVRQEWLEGERKLAAIVRPDRETTILVDLARNLYVEQPIPPDPRIGAGGKALSAEDVELMFAGTESAFAVDRERIGSETVAGHPCVVYRSRIASALGGASTSTVWEAEDLDGLVVRSELKDPDGALVTVELRDVRMDPEPELFDAPPTARRVDRLDAP